MDFPQLLICSQIGYKTDVLTDMELPKNILNALEPRRLFGNNSEFDAQNVWDNGTNSLNDFAINWLVIQGKLGAFDSIKTFLIIVMSLYQYLRGWNYQR